MKREKAHANTVGIGLRAVGETSDAAKSSARLNTLLRTTGAVLIVGGLALITQNVHNVLQVASINHATLDVTFGTINRIVQQGPSYMMAGLGVPLVIAGAGEAALSFFRPRQGRAQKAAK